jgi:hypothetical protein
MSDIEEMIAACRRLAALPEEAAKLAAPAVLKVAKDAANAGVSPTGETWAPLKKGGGKPLKNAAAALSVKTLGTIIQLLLKGPEVVHNFGTNSTPKRQILPDAGAGMPPTFAQAVKKAAGEAFDRLIRG